MSEKQRCSHCGSPDTKFTGSCGPEYPHLDAWWCWTCSDGEFLVDNRNQCERRAGDIGDGRSEQETRDLYEEPWLP